MQELQELQELIVCKLELIRSRGQRSEGRRKTECRIQNTE
jgi:hypothetical protein